MEGASYDVLLLDVMLPGITGLQAAREIRARNESVQIVFLTSSPEFAVESYSVRAHHYLLKPATQDKLFPILDRLAQSLRYFEEALCIHTASSVLSLPYAKLEYVEVNAKTLFFHLTDGSVRQVGGSLADLEQTLLARPGFIKTHRAYLVHLRWVEELGPGELLTASGKRIPVARSFYSQVRVAYTRFLFTEDTEVADL
ncbi:Transcriptional regulatory protein BtsR [bioreactor metagenome]|uniref:Transcriptional regulatory protein BtsR n=1 Tax=bioreactor metagenome TaxID=1076179 RepID=A0A645D5Z9_9ZZZZ